MRAPCSSRPACGPQISRSLHSDTPRPLLSHTRGVRAAAGRGRGSRVHPFPGLAPNAARRGGQHGAPGKSRRVRARVMRPRSPQSSTRSLPAIPHDRLAILVGRRTRVRDPRGRERGWRAERVVDSPWEGTSARLARQIDRVPAEVEVGVHLCYGDVAEQHFVEPGNTENLTRFANLVVAAADRPLTWLRLPVPIERDDAECCRRSLS